MKKPFRKDWNPPILSAQTAGDVFLAAANAHRSGTPCSMKGDALQAALTTEVVILRGVVATLAKELFDRMDVIQSSLNSLNRVNP